MDTPQNTVTQDPLGLKRFALTESAYDLVNSLVGVYSRLAFEESEQINPDAHLMQQWQQRGNSIQALYYHQSWADLMFVENLINDLSIEYKQVTELEENRISQSKYATHPAAKSVSII